MEMNELEVLNTYIKNTIKSKKIVNKKKHYLYYDLKRIMKNSVINYDKVTYFMFDKRKREANILADDHTTKLHFIVICFCLFHNRM